MNNKFKISVITPSFNQGRFIKDTIDSVLLQNYSNYEHIIIDGGSTDNTINILKQYPHLKWISEPDNGPANALNKGFSMISGDIVTWINSDDYYDNNVFYEIISGFSNNCNADFLFGNLTFVDEYKNIILRDKTMNYNFDLLVNYYADSIRQPAIFFKKSLLDKVGKLDESLKIVFDYDLFVRMIKIADTCYINKNIVFVRDYKDTITRRNLRKQGLEILKVSKRNGGKLINRLLFNTILRKIIFPGMSIIKHKKDG